MKNVGRLQITHEALNHMLQLDPKHSVINMHVYDDDFEIAVFSIIIEGPGCPEISEGGSIPKIGLQHSEFATITS